MNYLNESNTRQNSVQHKKKVYIIDYNNKIAKGKYTTIYMAYCENKKLNQMTRVVCKQISKEDSYKGIEAKILSLPEFQAHPNIIHLFHLEIDSNNWYLFMPYYELTLFDYLEELINNSSYLTEKAAYNIFRQLFGTIKFCHECRIVHRDIKLENIMLVNTNPVKIVVIDFGYSVMVPPPPPKFSHIENYCILTDYPGTYHYAAPELFGDKPYNGYAADVWSMGIVLYSILYNALPFYAECRKKNIQRIRKRKMKFKDNPVVSAECKHLMKKMLKKNPKKRITTKGIQHHVWFANNK